jgi:MoaA/NifB/PqqE/SkfB family radical SAM enzyme
LPELIAHAEQLGQISGLLSDGLRLLENTYLDALLNTGLDHLMIVLRPEQETAWQALKNSLVEDLFVAVHLTLTPQNQSQIPLWLERLADMGVHEISLSANDSSLAAALEAARDWVAALDLNLVWNLPVPYSALNPVALEISDLAQPQSAGRAWMYVEPDGDVLPAQDAKPVLGNLLNDPWEQIWGAANRL